MILYLFGYPGSGKNFVGEILQEDFDFFFYDSDNLLTPEMKILMKRGVVPENYLRVKKEKYKELRKTHAKLVLAEPLPQKPAQNEMFKLLPEAKFVRIVAPKNLIIQRLTERKNSFVDVKFASHTFASFEEPEIPYIELHNDEGKEKIRIQLSKILNIA